MTLRRIQKYVFFKKEIDFSNLKKINFILVWIVMNFSNSAAFFSILAFKLISRSKLITLNNIECSVLRTPRSNIFCPREFVIYTRLYA